MASVTSDDVRAAVDLDAGEVPIVSKNSIDYGSDGDRLSGPPEIAPVVRPVSRWKWERILAGRDAAHRLDSLIADAYGSQVARTGIKTNEQGEKELVVKTRSTSRFIRKHVTEVKEDEEIVREQTDTTKEVLAHREAANHPVSIADLKEKLPGQIDGIATLNGDSVSLAGIPVSVEERKERLCDNFTDRIRPVCGGAGGRSYRSKLDPFPQDITTCMPAYKEGGWRMLTAGHVFKDTDGDYFPRVYQPHRGAGGNYIGNDETYTFDYNRSGDAIEVITDVGLIDLQKADETAQSYLQTNSEKEDYTFHRIDGVATWDGISMIEDDNGTVSCQGRSSGGRHGSIEELTPSHYWMEVDMQSEGGDSGGPFFNINRQDPRKVDVLGIVSTYNRSDQLTGGNAAEFALDEVSAQF